MQPCENSDQISTKTLGRELSPMTKDNRCSNHTGLSHYIPRSYSLKRAYSWLMNGTRMGTFSNKKQAIEVAINKPDVWLRSAYPLEKGNVSIGINSDCPSILGQVQGGLASRPSPSLFMATDGMSTTRKEFKNACRVDALVKSHSLKISDVLDSENVVSTPIRNSFEKIDEGKLLRTTGSNKYYGSFWASRCPYHGNDTPLVICTEGVYPLITLGSNNGKKTNAIVSNRADEESMKDASRMAIAKNKAIIDYSSFTHFPCKANQMNIVEPYVHQDNIHELVIHNGGCIAHQMSSGNNKNKGKGVVLGGAKVNTNHWAITGKDNFAQSSGPTSQVCIVKTNANIAENNSNMGGSATTQKARGKKKLAADSDPSPDMHSLSNKNILSTGVFDGAPVKYIMKRRRVILHGVIKGSKILCSCNECDNSTYIGSCKFERHAGGKTKRPYCSIYLENGKSLHQVCREIRATPKQMLFDRLPEIAGSAFGWLSFNNWKGPSNLDSSPMAPQSIKIEPLQ